MKLFKASTVASIISGLLITASTMAQPTAPATQNPPITLESMAGNRAFFNS